jgi:hypothetical protein
MSNMNRTPMPLGGDKPFERADSTVYQLMHHGWIKGVEQFRNRIWFNVNVDRESGISREEAAAFIAIACNAYNGLIAGNAQLREDLSDARTGWEQATEAVREAEAVREQLVAALRKALQLTDIASDWDLDEVEIDGEMVETSDLRKQFRAALAAAEAA